MHKGLFFDWSTRVTRRFFDPDDPGDDAGGGEPGGGGDDPGASGDHPNYEIPGHEGAGDDAAGGAKPPARAGAPSSSAGRGEGDPGTAGGGKKPGTTDTVPGYRLQEVVRERDALTAEFSTLKEENKRFKALIAGALGIQDPSAPGQPKPLTEREQQLADRIVQLLPWLGKLKGLADKADVVGGLADAVPEFRRQNEGYWQRVAQATFSAVDAAVAPLLLGEGKQASDLSKEAQAYYRGQFFQWVNADEKRVARYESGDGALANDFAKMLEDVVVGPMRRRFGAGAISRDAARRRLPVGGNTSGPVAGAPPQKPKPLNEDEAADAAWKALNAAVSAQG